MRSKSYLVLDLETGCKEHLGRKGSPWANDIAAYGLKYSNNTVLSQAILEDNSYDKSKLDEFLWLNDVELLIGHNIKFDLLHIWNDEQLQEWFKKGGSIWDTSVAEYLLTGQQHKFPALRNIAVTKYDCQEREKKMEEYWKKGIDTHEIPEELVLEDVYNDVLDTEAIYLQQVEKAKALGMFEFILSQMDATLALCEIEYNGIYINREVLRNKRDIYHDELKIKIKTAYKMAKDLWPTNDLNLESTQQLSILFFGGTIKVKEKEPILTEVGDFEVFKSGHNKGQLKLKNVEREQEIKGFGLKPKKEWASAAKDNVYSTNEAVLQELSLREDQAGHLAKLLLEIRGLRKLISTYFNSTLDVLHDNSIVHPQFIQVKTDTGRLSCTNINAQNQPDDAKHHFTSRWGREGIICSADYSQLEPCVQAELSHDINKQEDIKNGIDEHVKKLAIKEGMSYEEVFKLCKIDEVPEWVAKRRKAKNFTFQDNYGASSKAIAAKNDMTLDEVLLLKDSTMKAYPNLAKWNKDNQRTVEGQGWLSVFTGQRFYFKRLDKPWFYEEYRSQCYYMPTMVKNYPIQGTASAALALAMIGKFWRERAIYNRHVTCDICLGACYPGKDSTVNCNKCNGTGKYDKYLMINTVHDSLILDSRIANTEQLKDDLQVLTNVQQLMYNTYLYKWQTEIKIDIKIGNSWYDCK